MSYVPIPAKKLVSGKIDEQDTNEQTNSDSSETGEGRDDSACSRS